MREIIRPVYVIYHDQCPDGFGAAWAAFQALGYTTGNGSPVHYIPSKYGQRPPEMDPEGMVYILDFSYNLETMSKLWHRHGGRVALLDHHKSATEELQGQLPGCHFDMNRSGAAIAWDYFKPFERMPELLAYVQDRDLWRWELPDSRAVNAAIEAAPMDFEAWSKLEIEELRTQGQPVVDRNNRSRRAAGERLRGADRGLHRTGGGGGRARVGDRRAAPGTPPPRPIRGGVPPQRRPRRQRGHQVQPALRGPVGRSRHSPGAGRRRARGSGGVRNPKSVSEAGGSDKPPRAETDQRRQRGAHRRQKEQTMTAKTVINTDGACYGNPGPVGFAAIIDRDGGRTAVSG